MTGEGNEDFSKRHRLDIDRGVGCHGRDAAFRLGLDVLALDESQQTARLLNAEPRWQRRKWRCPAVGGDVNTPKARMKIRESFTEHESAAIDEANGIDEPLDFIEIVGGHENRPSLFASQFQNTPDQVIAYDRIEAAERFIEDEEPRP